MVNKFCSQDVAREVVEILAKYDLNMNATEIVFDAVREIFQSQKFASPNITKD